MSDLRFVDFAAHLATQQPLQHRARKCGVSTSVITKWLCRTFRIVPNIVPRPNRCGESACTTPPREPQLGHLRAESVLPRPKPGQRPRIFPPKPFPKPLTLPPFPGLPRGPFPWPSELGVQTFQLDHFPLVLGSLDLLCLASSLQVSKLRYHVKIQAQNLRKNP